MKKHKATFIMSLKLKDCKKIFKEGFDPGVVVTQEVTFEFKSDKILTNMEIASIIEQEHEFLNNHVEVVTKQIE